MSLQDIAQQLVAPTKGILAADESAGTIKKRFGKIDVESTKATRCAYRELLFTTPGIEAYISGVIMYDETIRQSAADGTPFAQVLSDKGIIPGIKVDQGTEHMESSPEELVTKGLDGLAERLTEYYALGARFAKWRAVFSVRADDLPTDECIQENARRLAEYARVCQQEQVVPIIEPEVLMDCCASIEHMYSVTRRVLVAVFAELKRVGIALDGVLLKPNMVVPGTDHGMPSSAEVARMTLRCLLETVPAEVPGIVFLSGGQSEQEACRNLQAISTAAMAKPWQLSFSFGRALQNSALETWSGKTTHVSVAQQVFLKRASLVSLARQGRYSQDLESV